MRPHSRDGCARRTFVSRRDDLAAGQRLPLQRRHLTGERRGTADREGGPRHGIVDVAGGADGRDLETRERAGQAELHMPVLQTRSPSACPVNNEEGVQQHHRKSAGIRMQFAEGGLCNIRHLNLVRPKSQPGGKVRRDVGLEGRAELGVSQRRVEVTVEREGSDGDWK